MLPRSGGSPARAGSPRDGSGFRILGSPRGAPAWRLLSVILLLSASACFTVRYQEGAQVPSERVADIMPGVTSRSDVLRWFGAPQTFTNTSMVNELIEDLDMSPEEALRLPFADAMVFRFTKGRVKGTVLGFWNQVDVRVTTDTLVVFFDEQDKVSSYGYEKGTDELDAPQD